MTQRQNRRLAAEHFAARARKNRRARRRQATGVAFVGVTVAVLLYLALMAAMLAGTVFVVVWVLQAMGVIS